MQRKKNANKMLTDLERNNKTVMLTHFIITLVMLTFCLLQTLSGMQTWGYILIMALLGLAPVAAEWFYWRKNTKTPMIKHLVAIGFALFYTAALFTSTNNMVFVFVVPMILMASIFNDTKYSLLINIGTITESLIVVIIGAKTNQFGYAGLDSAIIQVVFMILIAIFSFLTSQTINQNMRQKIEHIETISRRTQDEIEAIHLELEKLNQSSQITKAAMREVTTGITYSAETIQNQLSQTNTIQNQVSIVDTCAEHISENMEKTLAFINDGSYNIAQLVTQVDSSVETSLNAVETLNTLEQNMKEMQTIVRFIDDISFQTNLLALNANVEAAHAGESGKGFSVIASHISEMSNHTKEATEHITSLIENMSAAIGGVVEVIQQMINSIHTEKNYTANTSESFLSIQNITNEIHNDVASLISNLTQLTNANHAIADSVQTISSISTEVSIRTSETMSSEEKNAETVETIAQMMENLLEVTQTENLS